LNDEILRKLQEMEERLNNLEKDVKQSIEKIDKLNKKISNIEKIKETSRYRDLVIILSILALATTLLIYDVSTLERLDLIIPYYFGVFSYMAAFFIMGFILGLKPAVEVGLSMKSLVIGILLFITAVYFLVFMILNNKILMEFILAAAVIFIMYLDIH